MSSNKFFRSECSACKRETRHVTLHKEFKYYSDPEDYRYNESHEIIECQGCERVSFRTVSYLVEHAYRDEYEEWQVPEIVDLHPQYEGVYYGLDNMIVYSLPEAVQDIYQQTIKCLHCGALALAGLGLRATIEAVCNHKQIGGKNLQARISSLATNGFISRRDSDRLHAIRFMGNDAAHQIISPKKEQISVALKIVNHLLESVYILEREANGTLDVLISDFQEFLGVVKEGVGKFSVGDELPLATYLGDKYRRISDLSNFESGLVSEINSGTFKLLALGKNDVFGGATKKVQHFVVQSTT